MSDSATTYQFLDDAWLSVWNCIDGTDEKVVSVLVSRGLNPGGESYSTVVTLKDGTSTGLKLIADPEGVFVVTEPVGVATPTGMTDLPEGIHDVLDYVMDLGLVPPALT